MTLRRNLARVIWLGFALLVLSLASIYLTSGKTSTKGKSFVFGFHYKESWLSSTKHSQYYTDWPAEFYIL